MLNDVYMCNVNVLVCLDEVICEDGGIELRRCDRVLLSDEIHGLLLSVCRNYDQVVRFCIAEPVSEGTTELRFATSYEVSMSPSSIVQTVYSTTSCTPVFSSLCTLYSLTLSFPYLA